jgi:AraC-like DNA-binding protein
VRASALSGFVDLVGALGGDPWPMFAEVGVDPGLLNSPDRFMSAHNVYRLLNVAARTLKRRDLGLLMGVRTDLLMMGPLFIAQSHARTGREALDLAGRFLHTQTQTVEVAMVAMPDPALEFRRIRNLLKNQDELDLLRERQMVVVHRLVGEICGPDYRPRGIWFAHQRGAPLDAYVKAFGIEPEFDCAETGIVLERRMLDRVRPNRNPQLAEMAVQYLKSMSARDAGFADEVTSIIRILMRSSDCTSTDTARALGMHERTLQRRLSTEGLSFEQLKDSVRREAAARLLADHGVSVTQVAHILQYANSSAFTRASRRWFGDSPSAVRARLLAGERAEVGGGDHPPGSSGLTHLQGAANRAPQRRTASWTSRA